MCDHQNIHIDVPGELDRERTPADPHDLTVNNLEPFCQIRVLTTQVRK